MFYNNFKLHCSEQPSMRSGRFTVSVLNKYQRSFLRKISLSNIMSHFLMSQRNLRVFVPKLHRSEQPSMRSGHFTVSVLNKYQRSFLRKISLSNIMSHFLMSQRNLRVFVPKSIKMQVICSLQCFCCFGDRLKLPLG